MILSPGNTVLPIGLAIKLLNVDGIGKIWTAPSVAKTGNSDRADPMT